MLPYSVYSFLNAGVKSWRYLHFCRTCSGLFSPVETRGIIYGTSGGVSPPKMYSQQEGLLHSDPFCQFRTIHTTSSTNTQPFSQLVVSKLKRDFPRFSKIAVHTVHKLQRRFSWLAIAEWCRAQQVLLVRVRRDILAIIDQLSNLVALLGVGPMEAPKHSYAVVSGFGLWMVSTTNQGFFTTD